MERKGREGVDWAPATTTTGRVSGGQARPRASTWRSGTALMAMTASSRHAEDAAFGISWLTLMSSCCCFFAYAGNA